MNYMEQIQCQYTLLDAHTVLFRIDVTQAPGLVNPEIVAESMHEFMEKYPRVLQWQAGYNGNFLDIIVRGEVNFQRVKEAGFDG